MFLHGVRLPTSGLGANVKPSRALFARSGLCASTLKVVGPANALTLPILKRLADECLGNIRASALGALSFALAVARVGSTEGLKAAAGGRGFGLRR